MVETIDVEINGKTFFVVEKEGVRELLKEIRPSFTMEDFEYLLDDLYLHVGFSNGDLYRAIFGNEVTYDMAVPQDWFNANIQMIKDRKGVVWVYYPGDALGKPYYRDMALERLKGMIIQEMIRMDKENR